jgi:hypothetical protein
MPHKAQIGLILIWPRNIAQHCVTQNSPLSSVQGLPDGIFSNQKYQLEYVLEGLGVKILLYMYVCNGHLEYLTAVWNILSPFGTFWGYLTYFLSFWYVAPIKIWQTWLRSTKLELNFATVSGESHPSVFRSAVFLSKYLRTNNPSQIRLGTRNVAFCKTVEKSTNKRLLKKTKWTKN